MQPEFQDLSKANDIMSLLTDQKDNLPVLDENTPMQHKMIIIGALGYFILPVDLIPDFIPVAGFTDDAAALVACLKTVSENVTPDIKARAVNKLYDWFDSVEYEKVEEYDDDYTA